MLPTFHTVIRRPNHIVRACNRKAQTMHGNVHLSPVLADILPGERGCRTLARIAPLVVILLSRNIIPFVLISGGLRYSGPMTYYQLVNLSNKRLRIWHQVAPGGFMVVSRKFTICILLSPRLLINFCRTMGQLERCYTYLSDIPTRAAHICTRFD